MKPVIDVDADADAEADADVDEGDDAGGPGAPLTTVNGENPTSNGNEAKASKPSASASNQPTKDTSAPKSSPKGVEGSTNAGGEYEEGRVMCEECGGAVPIRDGDGKDGDGKGGFTTKHWDAHKAVWYVLLLSHLLLSSFRFIFFSIAPRHLILTEFST